MSRDAELVRITAHPTDTRIVILHVPHGRNELMGRYEPAQLDVELKGYLLHVDHLTSFERFATFAGLYLIDERAKTPAQLRCADLCDTCGKTERICQRAAGNIGSLRDHDYLSIAQADAKRSMPQPPTEAT